jgi:NADH-quinone oxidoreductase subunit E
MDLTAVDKVLQAHNNDKSMLVGILQDVQEHYRWLPKEVLTQISTKLDVAMSEIYQVVTFYKAFSLKPRGKHVCSICMGTACHVRGAPLILETMKKHLDVEPGQNTKDMQFTLNTVNCVGACAVGPVVQVDNTLYGNLTSIKSVQLLKKFEKD